jgi:hypothetical protein
MGSMNDKILAVFLAAMLPSLSFAQAPQNYQCSLGDLQRRVEILYETGVTVPCEVHYYKDSEAPGEVQVLWRALNEAGYCERMTESFVSKLGDLGWNCVLADAAAQPEEAEQGDEPAEAGEAAEADDTEALIPAEEPAPIEE